MDIEDYIKKIVDNGRIEDMDRLSDMLDDTLEMIQEYDKKCYEEYALELYKMAYGSKLNKEMAEKIVHNMKPYGEKWNYNETMRIQQERGLDNVSSSDFYTVLNSRV